MASGASGLQAAAAAAIAVFAALVMSSQGHPRTKPLCSDCPSLCVATPNCTAFVAEACNSSCSLPPGQCEGCEASALKACCQSFCSNSNDTSTVSSCCPSDCITISGSSSNCTSCSCGFCSAAAVQNSCSWPCTMHTSDMMRCNACKSGAGQQCATDCVSACNNNCVKNDC
ncbi:unnamed protein product [Urochloa decumbens]|uniref:Uncharacterized protein n=1 Tax=Urochloa decumbens TaxID=240449 RepID=A0ABC9B1K7_9POAL